MLINRLAILLLLSALAAYGQIAVSPGTVPTPIDLPGAGTYNSNQTVTITDGISGAFICYTTDGSTPTGTVTSCTHGTHYASSFVISSSTTLKAVACNPFSPCSAVDTAVYTILPLPGFVQIACARNPGTSSLALTFSSSVTSGDNIHVFSNARSVGSQTAPTDTGVNTYTADVAEYDGPVSLYGVMRIYSATNVTGGSSFTVTAHFGGSGGQAACAVETSAEPASPFDMGANNGASPSNSVSVGPFTTGQRDIVFVYAFTSNSQGTPTAGSGWTIPAGGFTVNGEEFLEYQVQAVAGAITGTGTFAGSPSSQGWGAQMVGYK